CKKKEESFEHLIACEVNEARWLEKEYSIANQIWLNLDTVVRKRMTIGDLYTSLTSGKEADKYRKRNYMARGLIESDLATSLLAIGITRKVADLIITEWWDKWHSFFQKEIWLQHCNEVAKWEKQVEINPKKRKQRNSIGKVIDKGGGGDLREEFEDELRRQKSEDKRKEQLDEPGSGSFEFKKYRCLSSSFNKTVDKINNIILENYEKQKAIIDNGYNYKDVITDRLKWPITFTSILQNLEKIIQDEEKFKKKTSNNIDV
ncbi:23212_t:CDS:2, partial [Gigaspora margarita]